jgi:hypothetical protein
LRFQVQASVYREALSDLDPAVLGDCARQSMRRSPFFPKVSELLRIARQVPIQTTDYLVNRQQVTAKCSLLSSM